MGTLLEDISRYSMVAVVGAFLWVGRLMQRVTALEERQLEHSRTMASQVDRLTAAERDLSGRMTRDEFDQRFREVRVSLDRIFDLLLELSKSPHTKE